MRKKLREYGWAGNFRSSTPMSIAVNPSDTIWEVGYTEIEINQAPLDPFDEWHREGLSPDGFSDLGDGNPL